MGIILEILKSLIYGFVQGITEWLPISSTGHLILINAMLPLHVFSDPAENQSFWEMYKVVIQLGSILAVVLLYFERLNPFSPRKDSTGRKTTWNLWLKIIAGSIPVGIIGLLLDDIVEAKLSRPLVVALMLIIYGVLFIVAELKRSRPVIRSVNGMDYGTAVKIGLFEALALIPGTSRSGATILGAMILGTTRAAATEFSFFMAIPAMLGASLLKLIKLQAPVTFGSVIVLLSGLITSFVVSVLVIRRFLKYIRRHDFRIFGLYRIILGLLILILALTGLLPGVFNI